MKQTTDSSLRNEIEIAKKWWIAENDYNQMQKLAAKYYVPQPNGRYFARKPDGLSDEEILFIYQQETNPKAIIGSGVEGDKATGGKWEVLEDYTTPSFDYEFDKEPCFSVRSNGGGYIIAEMVRNSKDEPPASQTSYANAKLICEAVNNYSRLRDSNAELLKELELFRDKYFSKDGNLTGYQYDEITSLINKAK